ncbi:MAG TPA: peptide chain release factor N(5)-glutamine methyltransferase [Actinomycetota bacterium]
MDGAQVVADTARFLADHDVETPEAEAEILLAHLLRTDRAGLYARREDLTDEERDLLSRMLLVRASGVPLQHLTGDQPFFGLKLRVRPGVFIPRPETEVLVEQALQCLRTESSPVVVDVGVGTGAVALAIKKERRDARVLATDASEDAVALAAENARQLSLGIELLRGDLLSPLPGELRGMVDLIVSNPPYVTEEEYAQLPEVVRAEPKEALVGGTELHARLAREALAWLRPGAWLAMEIGAGQGDEVAGLLSERYERVEIVPDLAGLDRVARGRTPEA